jgi:hypothetical protein
MWLSAGPSSSVGHFDFTVPSATELSQKRKTYLLEEEAFDMFVRSCESPFASVPMLEDPVARKVVLTHDAIQCANWCRRHRVGFVHLSPGHMERFLVAMNVVKIEIRMLVVPHAQ